MLEPHLLIWISPVVPQHELEGLFHWVNTHLSSAGLLTISSFSRIRTTLTLEPEEALALEFEIRGAGNPEALELFRENLWSEVFADSQPAPRPFAVSIQSESDHQTEKRLACFDMDSTLINEEVIDEMARSFGFYDEVSKITEAAMQGKLDFEASLRKRVALFRDLPLHQARTILTQLTLSPGAEPLLRHFKTRGVKTAIVSGGFEFILKHFEKTLGVDHVFGNHLTTDLNGIITGSLDEPIVDASYKQKLVRQMRENYGVNRSETLTIGDGANDLLMMSEGSGGISFCGKPRLAAVCSTLILNRNLLWLKTLFR